MNANAEVFVAAQAGDRSRFGSGIKRYLTRLTVGLAVAGTVGVVPEAAAQDAPNAAVLIRRGKRLDEKGDVQGAIKLYTQALALKGDEKEKGLAYVARGQAYIELERFDKAIADLT